MGRRYWPLGTKLEQDLIELPLRVPSGKLGLRWHGQSVLVRIDRDFGVEVYEGAFGSRLIVRGAVVREELVWYDLPASVRERELGPTALAMVGAHVLATAKLFRRGWLDGQWLTEQARFDLRVDGPY